MAASAAAAASQSHGLPFIGNDRGGAGGGDQQSGGGAGDRRRPTDRPTTDRGRLPQRMSEGLVGAGNRCAAAAAAAEAVASPESRQADGPAVRPSSSLSLFRSWLLPAFLLSSLSADRPTAANWRRN